MVTVQLRSPGRDVILQLCVSEFPWEQPRKEMKEIKFKGYPKPIVPSENEAHNMPKILLGTRAALLLPEALPEESVPPAFRRKWPGLEVFKSRITGNLIFSGMLPRREGPYACIHPHNRPSISLLAFTANTEIRAMINNPTKGNFWPPEQCPLSLVEDTQQFLLGLISWRHNIQEVRDVICVPNQSTSAGQLKMAGCLRCCPLAKELSQVNRHDVLLDGQLSFAMDSNNESSRFQLHRLHNHLIKFLPSGEAHSKGCTHSLIKRLARQPNTAKLINEKLRQEYEEGKSRWVDPEELATWQKSWGLSPHYLSPSSLST